MADKVVTLTIREAGLPGLEKLHPNTEMTPDPGWVDPKDGSVAPEVAKYTDSQWVTEKIRRMVVRDIRRGLQMTANQAARVAADDSMVEAV